MAAVLVVEALDPRWSRPCGGNLVGDKEAADLALSLVVGYGKALKLIYDIWTTLSMSPHKFTDEEGEVYDRLAEYALWIQRSQTIIKASVT